MSSISRIPVIAFLILAVTALLGFFLLPVFTLAMALSLVAGSALQMILVFLFVTRLQSNASDVSAAATSEILSYNGETVTLYVGNLPYRANEDAVKALFAQFGIVINVRLMKDRQTGRRRGFGFVEVAAKDAATMITQLNDLEFQERTLKVREAREKQDDE